MSSRPVAPQEPRVFWSSDLHDGFRCDTATVLAAGLGQEVILGGHKDRSLPHQSCLNGGPSGSVHFPQRPYSPLIASHRGHSDYISEVDVRNNFEYYRNDPDIARVDAFVCLFPMGYCEAWLPFNKTIVYIAGHRYALGRCSAKRWERLNKHLLEASAAGHIVAASTLYDQAYINYYTGLDVPLLPMSALWYAGWRDFASPAAQARSEILVGPLQREAALFAGELVRATGGRFVFATAKQLYGRFQLADLAHHRAAVLFPYTAHSSFGIAELYALGVPLFVPSPELLLSMGLVDDRLIAHPNYCGYGSFLPPRHALSCHERSPESSEREDSLYWLRKADFYALPHITSFSSFEDLAAKLAAADFAALRAAIAAHHAEWQEEVRARFAAVASFVPKGRAVPPSYEEAMRSVLRDTSTQAERRLQWRDDVEDGEVEDDREHEHEGEGRDKGFDDVQRRWTRR